MVSAGGYAHARQQSQEIRLVGTVEAWEGVAPAEIEGQTNPTLALTAGQDYMVTWENGDGAQHNFAIRDANGENIVASDFMSEEGATQTVEFTASEEMAQYVCEVHPSSMVGDVQTDTETATPEPTETPGDGGGGGEQPTASVSFEDQTTDGSSVEVASVTMSDGGFVAIHDSRLLEGDALGSVIGVSEYLEGTEESPTAEGLTVSLDESPEDGETLIAMPHLDTNDNQTYDFVTSEGADDGPYTDAEGAVTDDATVTLQDDDGGQPTASVSFEDQTTDGSSVEVASVMMSDGGFVTIHDSSLLDGAVLESVVGVSEALDAGTHEGIEVTLFEGVPGAEFDQDALQEDETLIAMPHFDSNDNGTYDFVTSEGADDGPYTDAEGAITDDASVTVEAETPGGEAERFVADLSGEGHGIDTRASGHAEFEVDPDAREVHYTLEVEELCDATMAHIHLGGEGEDGPVVVWLYPTDQQEPRTKEGRFTGTLAEGTFTTDDLVGPLEGQSLDDLRAMHTEQGAYVNVHTEDHPGGEIRGQIEPAE